MDNARCPACGQANLCGIAAGEIGCWCMQQPAINNTLSLAVQSCWCKACLAKQFNASPVETKPADPTAS